MNQDTSSDDGETELLDLDAVIRGDDGGDDDPDPPAAGAVGIGTSPGPSSSLAPKAEPNHVVAPQNTPVA